MAWCTLKKSKTLNSKILKAHKSWPLVKEVFQKLHSKGHKVFLVGGVVRDLFLHRSFEDFDLVTDASSENLSKLFPEALEVGKSFGVFKLPLKGLSIELSGFRKDGPYKDGRHPSYTQKGTQEEDAKRRDFTINALFYDVEKEEVIDYFEGIKDLQNALIRTIGSPKERFEEDFLRLLRALRFASELNFDIERESFLWILKLSSKLKLVSKERIQKELEKLLLSSHRLKGINFLIQSSLLKEFFPFYDLYKRQDPLALKFWIELKGFLSELKEPSLSFVFSSLFLSQIQFWQKKKVREWKEGLSLCIKGLKDLKFSNLVQEKTTRLLQSQFEWSLNPSLFNKLQILEEEGKESFDLLWSLFIPNLHEEEALKTQLEEEKKKVFETYKTLLGNSKKLPSPWIGGEDLKQMGWKEGKKLGCVLEEVYRLQLEGEFKDSSQAFKWLKERKKA